MHDPNVSVGGTVAGDYTAAWPRPITGELPLFEALAQRYSAERTFGALSLVGLSDALAFVKPYWMLSRGQQYRAMIAELLLREDGVWLLDEFCGDLDPITAKVVGS